MGENATGSCFAVFERDHKKTRPAFSFCFRRESTRKKVLLKGPAEAVKAVVNEARKRWEHVAGLDDGNSPSSLP